MAFPVFSRYLAALAPIAALFAVPGEAAPHGEGPRFRSCLASDPSEWSAGGRNDAVRITWTEDAGLALAGGTGLRLGDIRLADRLPDMTGQDRQRIRSALRQELKTVFAEHPLFACMLAGNSAAPAADRYGRLSIDAIGAEQPFSLRRHLVSRGLAVVLPDAVAVMKSDIAAPDPCCDALYRAEARARTGKMGVWATATPLIRTVDPKTGAVDLPRSAFAIVEGRVRSVGDRERDLYLNFGYRWTTDFTATIPKRGFSGDAAALERLARLSGSRIRVRGIADPWQGGRIPVISADQIEILAPPMRPPAVAD